ncbi:FG-GAP-like repeat-containing protein [Fulvimarina manganoxydans]|uniref:FG-GAP-like repeat-containing protein n=1 Tax=Fulvimarina manganoxydans TaxID=937218 RepID=UPI001482AB05|nr:FG-GAP-like repeat-containing protein [Fulvimarina manganoxydans]
MTGATGITPAPSNAAGTTELAGSNVPMLTDVNAALAPVNVRTPVLIDSDVTFTDADFRGGSIVVSGLLATDRVALLIDNVVSLSGSSLSVNGNLVGTISGGTGSDFSITLNSSADAAIVETLIEHLTYERTANSLTAGRSLAITVTDDQGLVAKVPSYAQATGAANPFSGISVDGTSIPAFADVDGDGDVDLVLGNGIDTLATYLQGPNGVYTLASSNPFAGIIGSHHILSPSFGDVDGDGKDDLVLAAINGTLTTYSRGANGSYSEKQTDAFAELPKNQQTAYRTFTDVDGDGDDDLVVGNQEGTLTTYLRETNGSYALAATNPFADISSIYGTIPAFADVDGDGDQDLVLGGLRTTPLVYLKAGNGSYAEATTPFSGVDFSTGILPVFADIDGDGDTDFVSGNQNGTLTTVINTPVVPTVSIPAISVTETSKLSGLTASLSATEQTPVVIDSEVTFTNSVYGSGSIVVSGLLTEDRVGLSTDGAVTLSGNDVSLNGATVGTVSGGTGTSFTITLNATADAAMVETLLEHLTYEDTADAPTANRVLTVTVTDDRGATTAVSPFAKADTFSSVDVGYYSAPTFADVNGDGHRDLVVGNSAGTLTTYLGAEDGSYTLAEGTGNPFDGFPSYDYLIRPAFTQDGRELVFVGSESELITYSRGNDGSGGSYALAETNPFSNVGVSFPSSPAFGDVDGDGDDDLVIGNLDGTLTTYLRAEDDSYALATANPLANVLVGRLASPTFGDVDGDGDDDLVVGDYDGALTTYLRAADGSYSRSATEPFEGIGAGTSTTPVLEDVDGDGDDDLIVGNSDGTLTTILNTSVSQRILVTVAAVDDAPTFGGDGAIAVLRGQSVAITTADLTANDVDSDNQTLTYTVTAATDGSVTLDGRTLTAGTGTFTQADLSGSKVAFLQDGTDNASASFTVSVSDGVTTATNTRTVTATVDTTSPSVSITTGALTHAEGDGGATDFTYTVTRTGNLANASTLAYAVTGSGTHEADSADFFGNALPTGTVSFAANEASADIIVKVAGDRAVESDEGFTLTLSKQTNASLVANTTQTGTITNDDHAPTITGTSAGHTVGDNATISPFTNVTLGDTDGDSLTVTITTTVNGSASEANGVLSGTSLTGNNGVYQLTGTASDVMSALKGLVFTPTENQVAPGQTVTTGFNLSVSDGANTTTDTTTSVVATSINDAPILDASKSPTLSAEAVNATEAPSGPVGTLVSQLIALDDPLSNVTDADVGAMTGIALTATSGAGSWYYSINGGTTWADVGTVDHWHALYLAPDARLYFQNTSETAGTVANAIAFHAWDQTAEINGSKSALDFLDPQSGSTSQASDTASLELLAVPTITNVTSSTADGAYKAGDVIDVSVTFSETVTVYTTNGTPQLTLQTGSSGRSVDYSSGSGSTLLHFSYTIQGGDTSADLDYVSSAAFALNGAQIISSSTNFDAVLTLPSPGSSGSLGANKAILIDTTAPDVPSLALSQDNGSSNSDGVTNDGTIIVTGLEKDASWTYSTNGGVDWTAGSGDSFILTEGSYGDEALRVWQTDLAGNESNGVGLLGNVTIDTTAPTLASATVNGASLVLTYTDALDLDGVVPATSAFAVDVSGATVGVNAVTVDEAAKTVTLTLASAVSNGQVVSLAYTDPNPAQDDTNGVIQDAADNDAASFTGQAVTNLSPSVGGGGGGSGSGNVEDPVYPGTEGDDTFTDIPFPASVEGGAGTDTIVFTGNFSDFTLSPAPGGFTIVQNADPDNAIFFSDIEALRFDDLTLERNDDPATVDLYALYQMVFDRPADIGGLSYWKDQADNGLSFHDIAAYFIQSSEFTSTYGSNPSPQTLIDDIYQNIFGRAPDATGEAFWLDAFQKGLSVPDFLTSFSDATELRSLIENAVDDGLFLIA